MIEDAAVQSPAAAQLEMAYERYEEEERRVDIFDEGAHAALSEEEEGGAGELGAAEGKLSAVLEETHEEDEALHIRTQLEDFMSVGHGGGDEAKDKQAIAFLLKCITEEDKRASAFGTPGTNAASAPETPEEEKQEAPKRGEKRLSTVVAPP